MINNLKITDQCNNIIYNEIYDDQFSLSSGTPMYPLILFTVSLRGGKKNKATIIYGPICLWDSRSTNVTFKRQHTGAYELKVRSNNFDYSIAVWP